jgi:TonB family protein
MIIDILALLARANLAGGAAIVAVTLLRWPVRSMLGAAAAYRLWAIPPAMALASLVPMPPGGALTPIMLGAASVLPSVAPVDGGEVWPAMVCGAWVLGMLACAALLGAEQLRFVSALRGGTRGSLGGTLVVRAAAAEIGPAVVGRSIILPADFEARFTPAEQAAILAHEAQHLARGDVVANVVVAVIQCLCWFNPFVHLSVRWFRFDQELACDAAVIAQRPGLRRPYAEALLKTQTVTAIPPLGCAWRARGFAALRSRIRLLKQHAPTAPRRACGILVVLGLTLGGGYSAWAIQPSQHAVVVKPAWSVTPNGADFARLYPARARAKRVEGMAVMRCRVALAGALSACAIVRESPRGMGFGDATLRMAPLFRMKPGSVNGTPVAGAVIHIPVRFALPARQRGQS